MNKIRMSSRGRPPILTLAKTVSRPNLFDSHDNLPLAGLETPSRIDLESVL